MSPLAAVATLAIHGRSPGELPTWCDIAEHLVGGAVVALDPPEDSAICDLLGPLYELMLADPVRRSSGVHFTRRTLADGLVASATSARSDLRVEPNELIVDPACGGGAFLLAAARHLRASRPGRRPPSAGEVLGRLVAADLDPGALVVARAAMARWALDEGGAGVDSGGSGVVVGAPTTVCADALTRPEALSSAIAGRRVGLVVGNPPFLAQLRAGTRHDARRRARLTERFGSQVGAYTDTAALFLLASLDLVDDGGVVCLIQPRSVLAARDAAGVRREVAARARLHAAWVGDGGFDASVEVWAPILVGSTDGAPPSWKPGPVPVLGGPAAESRLGTVSGEALTPDSWGALVAASEGLPSAGRSSGRPMGRLGEVARFGAGFRDEYYAMAELVEEAPGATLPNGYAALVSSGLIDPGECRWGAATMRFAKRRWRAPVVALDRLTGQTAPTRWARRQLVPKVLVASQTRVIEAAGDARGAAIGLTPVVSGFPEDITLAHLLAVLCSPVATLQVARTMAGSGMGRSGVRVSAKALADLDLPVEQAPWDEAASLLSATCDLGSGPTAATLLAVHELMVAAAAVDDPVGVLAWFEAATA